MNDDTVTCVSCGAQIPRNARFCPECGQVNAAASTAASAASDPVQENGSPTINIGNSPARVDQTDSASQDMSASAPTPFPTTVPEPAAYSPYASPPPTPPQGQPTQYVPPAQGGYTPPPKPYGQPSPAATENLNVYPGAQPPATTPQAPYPAYSQNPINSYQYQQQVGVAGIAPKDPTVALLLELIGYVGFLGIGHIYAGRITRGVVLMIGWWLYWGIVGVLFATILLSPVACIMAIAWPLVPIASGLWIRSDLTTNGPVVQSRF